MFGNKKLKQKIDKLEAENKMLQNEIVALVNRVNIKDKELQDLFLQVNEAAYNCPVAVDFDLMEAFSIERVPMDKYYTLFHTVIGYVVQDADGADQIKEWKLYCSEAQHERLVKEFVACKGERIYES